jgi:hypothetical protein
MSYRYTFMAFGGDLGPGHQTATSEELTQSITMGLMPMGNNITKALKELDGGVWEPLSHDTMVIGTKMITTVLMRRPE